MFSSTRTDGDDSDEEQAIERKLQEVISVGAAAEEAEGGVLGGAGASGRDGGGVVDMATAGRGGAVDVPPGISWAAVAAVMVSQLAFVGLFCWVASAAMRE